RLGATPLGTATACPRLAQQRAPETVQQRWCRAPCSLRCPTILGFRREVILTATEHVNQGQFETSWLTLSTLGAWHSGTASCHSVTKQPVPTQRTTRRAVRASKSSLIPGLECDGSPGPGNASSAGDRRRRFLAHLAAAPASLSRCWFQVCR